MDAPLDAPAEPVPLKDPPPLLATDAKPLWLKDPPPASISLEMDAGNIASPTARTAKKGRLSLSPKLSSPRKAVRKIRRSVVKVLSPRNEQIQEYDRDAPATAITPFHRRNKTKLAPSLWKRPVGYWKSKFGYHSDDDDSGDNAHSV